MTNANVMHWLSLICMRVNILSYHVHQLLTGHLHGAMAKRGCSLSNKDRVVLVELFSVKGKMIVFNLSVTHMELEFQRVL